MTRYAKGPVAPVGIIYGMPGSVLEAGQSKVPGGYSEETFSLPRWTWIDRARESMLASPINNDVMTVARQVGPQFRTPERALSSSFTRTLAHILALSQPGHMSAH